jgi:hypothetical protein
LPSRMSVKPWFSLLLSTLSLRDKDSGPSKNVALLGADSIDCGRSYRRGSALLGVVGDTMADTLMLLVTGDTRGWGKRFADVGDGVLSIGEVWKPETGGLRTPNPEAAEVSVGKAS